MKRYTYGELLFPGIPLSIILIGAVLVVFAPNTPNALPKNTKVSIEQKSCATLQDSSRTYYCSWTEVRRYGWPISGGSTQQRFESRDNMTPTPIGPVLNGYDSAAENFVFMAFWGGIVASVWFISRLIRSKLKKKQQEADAAMSPEQTHTEAFTYPEDDTTRQP